MFSIVSIHKYKRLVIASLLLSIVVWFYPSQSPALGRRTKKNTVYASDEHFDLGYKRMKDDDIDGAIDEFKQAVYFARNGYHPKANLWLGICYQLKGDYKLAEETLLRAVSQSVDPMPDAWLAIAEIRLKTKQPYMSFRKALQEARMAGAPREGVSYLYGLRSDMNGKFMTASQHYRQALGKPPWTWTKAWMKYAECKMKMKKWAEAVRDFQAILNSQKWLKGLKMSRIYHDIGVCKLALGDHQGAIDSWFRSLDYDQNNKEVWLQLGMLFESEKHFSSAIKYYKHFLQLCPTGSRDIRVPEVQNRITKIEHMLRPNETAPQPVAPSPYMRKELDGALKQQYKQQQIKQKINEQQLRDSQDSGF